MIFNYIKSIKRRDLSRGFARTILAECVILDANYFENHFCVVETLLISARCFFKNVQRSSRVSFMRLAVQYNFKIDAF